MHTTHIIRGEILHFLSDPADRAAGALEHFADGVLVVHDGLVAEVGPALDVLAKLPTDLPVTDYRGKLILPGFVDTHIHYAQTGIIASYGEQLLAWLEKYTFATSLDALFEAAQRRHMRMLAGNVLIVPTSSDEQMTLAGRLFDLDHAGRCTQSVS